MKKFVLAIVFTAALVGITAAGQFHAVIINANPDNNTIEYKQTYLKGYKEPVKANVSKDCVFREGTVILGKPLKVTEGEPIVNGLRNLIFENAKDSNPLYVRIYTADADDKDKGIRAGDVVKVLVLPKR